MASPLDVNNVQGDILYLHVVVSSFFVHSFFTGKGFPRRPRPFIFFRIDDNRVKEFREQLTELVPLITTTNQVKDDRKI